MSILWVEAEDPDAVERCMGKYIVDGRECPLGLVYFRSTLAFFSDLSLVEFRLPRDVKKEDLVRLEDPIYVDALVCDDASP